MPRPEITKQDQALLDFVNATITDDSFENDVDRLIWLSGFSHGILTRNMEVEDRIATRIGARGVLRSKVSLNGQAITMKTLKIFKNKLREILKECIQNFRIDQSVQKFLNGQIKSYRQKFNFSSGEFGPVAVNYDLDYTKASPVEMGHFKDEDFDLQIQTSPAIAKFLYWHVERLGQCNYIARGGICGAFFVAKRQTKTVCDRHMKAKSAAGYRREHKEELKEKERERREKRKSLVRRKRRK